MPKRTAAYILGIGTVMMVQRHFSRHLQAGMSEVFGASVNNIFNSAQLGLTLLAIILNTGE